jgi:hypothetical protein
MFNCINNLHYAYTSSGETPSELSKVRMRQRLTKAENMGSVDDLSGTGECGDAKRDTRSSCWSRQKKEQEQPDF